MSNIHDLSDVQVILLAAQYISDVNVQSLQVLASARNDVLTRDIIYRLLLTLYPSDETARTALLALLRSIRSDFDNVSQLHTDIDLSSVAHLSPAAASKLVNQLHVAPTHDSEEPGNPDALADFVVSWARHVEATDGALDEILALIDDSTPESPTLEKWASTYLLPVVRLRYSYYTGESIFVGLQELESAAGVSGVELLLQHAQRESTTAQIGRDLDEVVSPWIEGAVSLNGSRKASWLDVNQWILDTSAKDFGLAAKALLEWNGPPSLLPTPQAGANQERAALAQTGLAVVYSCTDLSDSTLRTSRRILDRVADCCAISLPPPEFLATSAMVMKASDADLLKSNLLRNDNKLTYVSQDSIIFLNGVLDTADILIKLKIYHSFADITRVCLSASEERHAQEMRRILQQVSRLTTTNPDWQTVRQNMLWLRCWRNSDMLPTEPGSTFLGHLSRTVLEESLLDSMLTAGQYTTARHIYLGQKDKPLDSVTVESHVLDVIYAAYDNASNGNRTRGGLKRATELLSTFKSSFPESQKFRDTEYLLKATHSLSFYQLTLQHGVPFRPVNIRVHKDPIDLVGRVLDQDTKAYTKLDDLLEIGRNLVLAQLKHAGHDLKSQLFEADRRITYLAITSALAAHDFDTAYSYLTTRLPMIDLDAVGDDYAWRAAYAAGRYRPVNPPKELHARISGLSKRMDLLSLSLTLAPQAESLSEILGQWRRCEEEMDALKSAAADEERAIEGQSETVPGGFGMQDDEMDAAETRQALAKRRLGANSTTYEDEAPVGLFDVAKGAASALRRSAFPLNAGSIRDLKVRDGHHRQGSDQSLRRSPAEDESGRVRKRDMMSNMVTSGLVSGMGWVLGAEPVNKKPPENE